MASVSDVLSTYSDFKNITGSNSDLDTYFSNNFDSIVRTYIYAKYGNEINDGSLQESDLIAFYTTGAAKDTIPGSISELKANYQIASAVFSSLQSCYTNMLASSVDINFHKSVLSALFWVAYQPCIKMLESAIALDCDIPDVIVNLISDIMN